MKKIGLCLLFAATMTLSPAGAIAQSKTPAPPADPTAADDGPLPPGCFWVFDRIYCVDMPME